MAYLVYKIGIGESIDSLSLGMLTNNSIPGLAQTLFTQMDEERYIKYNVSAKISMKQFFCGVVNRRRLLGAFEGIVDGLMSAEDYMIDTSGIILDQEYIFVDVTTCAATFICLPITNIETSNPDFKKLLDDLKKEDENPQTQPSANQSTRIQRPQPGFQPAASQPIQNRAYAPTPVPQGQSMNFGETTVLGGGRIGETTVLNSGMQQAQTITPHLIRNKNNEKIPVNKPVFRIGKEKTYLCQWQDDSEQYRNRNSSRRPNPSWQRGF